MANNLGLYNPLMYAQEALIQLEMALGMANTVYRGYDNERRSFKKGSTINIRRPGNFQAQNAPSTAQDIEPDDVTINLDKWKEVKFALTDQELAYTTEQIIAEHIRPAAYALATDIDSSLNQLALDVPWAYNVGSPAVIRDITQTRRGLFDNNVPIKDAPNMFMEVDGEVEADFLELAAFSQAQGAGNVGVDAQVSGMLGRKYGFGVYANQNVHEHVTGITGAATVVVAGATAAGATSLPISGGTLTGTIDKGTIIKIAGIVQQFVVVEDVVAAANAATVSIFPALPSSVSNEAITLTYESAAENLAYHRNAFAIALAPLPTTGNGIGARMATVSDPKTGLALRSRIFYNGDDSEVRVALDVLYGVKTLDGNLAYRMRKSI